MGKIYRIFYIDLKIEILKSSEFLIQYILITDYNFFMVYRIKILSKKFQNKINK